jgi:hypothetical protein
MVQARALIVFNAPAGIVSIHHHADVSIFSDAGKVDLRTAHSPAPPLAEIG